MFIDRFYKMDPSLEDLLFDGTFLRDGMTVTIGDSCLRMDLSSQDMNDPYYMDQVEIMNSWFTISYVVVHGSYVSFMAMYENGCKRKLTFPTRHPWLMKLRSTYKDDPASDPLSLPTTQMLPLVNTDKIDNFLNEPLSPRHGA